MTRLVVIVAPGSRGDVQPCVALGRGLHGDRVRVLAAERFRSWVTGHGLEFAPLSADPGEILGSDGGREWTEGGRNPATFLRGLRGALAPVLERLLADVHKGASGADLVLAPTLGFLGAHLGASLGVPDVELHYQPSMPTKTFAHPLLPWAAKVGPCGRRLSFRAVDTVAWQVLRPEVDRWRGEELGLPAAGWRGPRRAETPVLCGFSDAVVPRPKDWPARVHVTGYWFLDTPAEWRPEPRLRDFLAAGPPPVYVGFGSMRPSEAERTFAAVRTALRRVGLRGLLAADVESEDDLLAIQDVPHEWLFPRTAAVVHHGGAGTTAAALRAGVPALVCPVFSDQPYWGDRVSRLGAGPRPLPLRELTADALTARLLELSGNLLFRRGAQYVGARLREEDGVARACEVLRRVGY
ncbi:glycosyl transferase [Amycolatopsis thailandensis]|uniref:Glycosyl transferase n=1 Tax=Amycolatopsis thailandensis TaxID=589330 RepID=A0A229S8H8_9PSEU|nr:glycosyltransferase [Amycolatopsis thailandensis]OXM55237.1 glycosyl transferase [Amycolatopsis thailandensis]